MVGVYIGVRALDRPTPIRVRPDRRRLPRRHRAAPGNGGRPLALRPDQVRIVDPPDGDRTEFDGSEKLVDGKETTGWATDEYQQANFGAIKPGMGMLINLGAPTKVAAVR